jgi:hypothetical protein
LIKIQGKKREGNPDMEIPPRFHILLSKNTPDNTDTPFAPNDSPGFGAFNRFRNELSPPCTGR